MCPGLAGEFKLQVAGAWSDDLNVLGAEKDRRTGQKPRGSRQRTTNLDITWEFRLRKRSKHKFGRFQQAHGISRPKILDCSSLAALFADSWTGMFVALVVAPKMQIARSKTRSVAALVQWPKESPVLLIAKQVAHFHQRLPARKTDGFRFVPEPPVSHGPMFSLHEDSSAGRQFQLRHLVPEHAYLLRPDLLVLDMGLSVLRVPFFCVCV